jgi:anti-sigma regulatory factor (Ser/Thr protein kinase)
MEIVAEAVGNAVRHGDASAIAVDVAVVDDDLLIRVQDNGQSGLGVGSGMGSQVLQDCCLRWERRSQESGVVVEALLPLAANSFVTTAAWRDAAAHPRTVRR